MYILNFLARELWLASRAGSSRASKILARLDSSHEKWARADPYLRYSSWACKNTAFDSECDLKVSSDIHVAKQLFDCNVSCFSLTKSYSQIFFLLSFFQDKKNHGKICLFPN